MIDGHLDSLAPSCAPGFSTPAFSPDGKKIAFTGICARDARYEQGAYVVDVSTGATRKIFGEDTVSSAAPVWSPDGTSIALELSRGEDSTYTQDLVAVSIASGRRTSISKNGTAPAWSPNGSQIAYVSGNWREAVEIHLSRNDGSSDTMLFRNRETGRYSVGFGFAKQGNPGGRLVWSPNGQYLLFSRHYECGSGIWRLDIHSKATKQITAPARGDKSC